MKKNRNVNNLSTVVSLIILVVFLFSALYSRDLIHVAITTVLIVIILWSRRRLPSQFFYIFPLTASLFIAGAVLDWYHTFRSYDNLVHAVSGFTGSYFFGWILSQKYKKLKQKQLFLRVAGVGIIIGIIWEIFEYYVVTFLPYDFVLGVYDTVTDLMYDTLGALVAGFFSIRFIPTKTKYNRNRRK